MPDFFSGLLIDLRKIKTRTEVTAEPEKIIELFTDLLKGKTDASQKLNQSIKDTSDSPYRIGI